MDAMLSFNAGVEEGLDPVIDKNMFNIYDLINDED